LSIWRDEKRAQ